MRAVKEPRRIPKRGSPMNASLRRLGLPDYDAYLESDLWRSTRDAWPGERTCFVCDAPTEVLHHVSYWRLGCERASDLVPLCHGHHAEVHFMLRGREAKLAEAHVVLRARQ